MEGCAMEKTIKDYIYDLGRTELVHDYEAEVKRIIAMLDKQEELNRMAYIAYTDRLEKKIKTQEIIISSLAECLGKRAGDGNERV